MRKQVAEIFSKQLHVELPSFDSDLIAAGVLDSLQLVELIVQLERHFSIRISLSENEFENFRSIQGITALVVGKNGKGLPD